MDTEAGDVIVALSTEHRLGGTGDSAFDLRGNSTQVGTTYYNNVMFLTDSKIPRGKVLVNMKGRIGQHLVEQVV
ncbi:hypothetical protein VN97_g2428 [Penicillium thymicola]|uniref:Uncharacterized protein n=1 Tax=Penicillium thymicola TaxID=293382 RepID=A0AAI9TPH6_PENTH|nr:hypothetical protein VN97_g2428 [Penicillium thymicola]